MKTDGDVIPALLNYKQSAQLCGIKKSLWYSLNSSGKIPRPVRLGRRTLWARDELLEWIAAGWPSHEKWEKIKENRKKRVAPKGISGVF